ncbi:MAG: alpha/beta hydrolase [Candidatus Thermoplasmatota archaeon]|nr:alpha/beta hydrolase [Candidatus Thermoplasmatota archaeon]
MEPEKVSVAAHYRLPWLLTSFAKLLDFCSKGLATRFLWRIFCGPIKFKTPSREAEFYKKTEQEKIQAKSTNKEIMLYRIPNDGKKLLFVHGWNGRSSQFFRIIELLSDDGYDITAFDLPGHGRSTRSATNLPEITDLISEITKSRGPYHAIVCHSFGGVAALNAVRLGATFEKLVLISPGVYEIKPMFKTFVGLFGLDEEYYADRLFDLAESLYGSSPGEFGLDRFSKQIGIDTLIVHCEDDKEALKEIAIALHGDMKNSVLYMTDGLGHRRILRDQKVAEKVMNFL